MKVDLNQYQKLAARTIPGEWRDLGKENPMIIHGALKLAGEAGEVADMVGKWQGQGHDLDVDEMTKELGDVLWHLCEIATAMNIDLGHIAYRNLEKLQRRYPEGFDSDKSVNREEVSRSWTDCRPSTWESK